MAKLVLREPITGIMQAALIRKINLECMIDISDVSTTASPIDYRVYFYFPVSVSHDVPATIFSRAPDDVPKYSTVDFKFFGLDTIVMICIIGRIYTGKIL